MNDEFKSQLTALALDEVSTDERASIEALLAESPEAQAYADGTSEFCGLLTRTLAGSDAASLTDEQRSALARQLAGPGRIAESSHPVPRSRSVWASWTMGLGAAAAAVLVANHLWREQEMSGVAMGPAGTLDARMVGGGLPGARGGAVGRSENGPTGASGAASDPALATADVGRLLKEGLGYYDLGDFEKARDSFNRALALDPYNTAARRQLERTERRVGEYLLAARDHTRAKMLREVDETLEMAVPAAASEPAGVSASGALGRELADAKPDDRLGEAKQDDLAQTNEEAGAVGGRALLAAAPKAKADAVTGGLRFGDNAISNNAIDGLMSAEPQSSLDRIDLAKAPAKPAGLPGLAEAESRAGRPLIALSDGERSDARGLQSEPKFRFREMKTSTLRAVDPQAETYAEVPENPFLAVASAPLSTFSIDVDTASYANVRRFLNQGQRPPKAAVRLEEMVNYFRYDYPQPDGDKPFSVTVDLVDCPWQPQHRLARIGLQGKTVAREQRPAANLVFLVDVSGSMDEPTKLPLVRQSLHLLTSQLKGSDHVALVTYAGESGVALPSTSLEQKESVTRAIDALSAGGSTNGASGIQLAYQQARQHFKAGGVNRVLLATDGDFNVGITNAADLEKLITDEARTGVFLSVLGYGMGNLKDATMEMLADKGNGNYAYIDSLSEARKALGDQLEGTLHTIAKDVKIQIEFNPAEVRHYRLLGYENRLLAKEDFNDDKKDAGEIGAGHSVTALYEIAPTSAPPIQPPVDPLKYQPVPSVASASPAASAASAQAAAVDQAVSLESMTVKLRYKLPDGDTSELLEVPVVDRKKPFAEAPADLKFAASVAMTGLLLKDSAHKGAANWTMVRDLARAGKGPDPEGYRGEFLQLVEKAAGVAP